MKQRAKLAQAIVHHPDLVFLDEPKPEKGKHSATAGMNAAPVVAQIIRRSAPLLGVKPKFLDREGPLFASY